MEAEKDPNLNPAMEKQRQMLDALAENYISAAEKICFYVHDPKEKQQNLNELYSLAVEHAKTELNFEIKGKAVKYVTEKLHEVKDLEIRKVCYLFTYIGC